MDIYTLNLSKQELIQLNKLYELYQLFVRTKDNQRVDKVLDLAFKLVEREKSVAFCGHFSAGKSSMINHLIGETVLPASPIPTSANLVKLKIGNEHNVTLFFDSGEVYQYTGPFQLDEMKSFFIDGSSIEKVEIELPSSILPKGAIIMDTPGIDSADDAHRLATESALHLADACFYVMDYNHVQAEQNLLFAKEMVEAGRPLYLVINMIDKHQEEELPLDQFTKSVEAAYNEWGITPRKIFYTSLKDLDHHANELSILENEIKSFFQNREDIDLKSSLNLLIKEHLHFIHESQSEEREHLEQILESIDESERPSLKDQFKVLSERKEELLGKIEGVRNKLESELQNILTNAYLMSAETREYARLFLESSQKDFKTGYLFSKKKTEQVKKERLSAYLESLQVAIDTQLIWHIKGFLSQQAKNYGVSIELERDIQQLRFLVDGELPKLALKPGALVTGQSLLNYTNDLANLIKKQVKKDVCEPLFERFEELLLKSNELEIREIERELTDIVRCMDANEQLENMKNYFTLLKEDIATILQSQKYSELPEFMKLLSKHFKETTIIIENEWRIEKEQNSSEKNTNTKIKKEINYSMEEVSEQYRELVDKLDEAVHVLDSIPVLKRLAKHLDTKRTRLKNQQFTVALFGAFSAGKSSFANALIGEKLLPVSPNPTTASITRIHPADATHKNHTGTIKLKNKESLLEDLNEALEWFGVKAKNTEDAFTKGLKIIQYVDSSDKHLQRIFLKSFIDGYNDIKGQLGTEIEVSTEEFQQYISQESLSCYVEGADYYLESPITDKGITIVDTPGADSINARHTDVAFEYIKNADAILFVTYYNHAFSRADREFLIQLGRVKDQFSMDKMFFLVNAADLADSEEELEDVLSYVEKQLVHYGISNPNLYPVSSLNALKESKADAMWTRFEKDFYQFIAGDLLLNVMKSAQFELKNTTVRVRTLVDSARQNQTNHASMMAQYNQEKLNIDEILNNGKDQLSQEKLLQEIQELKFYTGQRIFIRYHDFFKECFNPSNLRGSGNEWKVKLQEAMQQLLTAVGFDLAQEMRALSFRIEKFIGKMLMNLNDTLTERLTKVNHQLTFSQYETVELSSPSFENELKDLPVTNFKKLLNSFTNSKAFFEKNEKKLLADQLKIELETPILEYLNKKSEDIAEYYKIELQGLIENLILTLSEEAKEQYDAFESVFNHSISLEELEGKLAVLEKISQS